MKNLILIFVFILSYIQMVGQQDTTKKVCIVQNDGSKFIGKILSQDSREVTIRIDGGRTITIPQYVIATITSVTEDDYAADGKYVGKDNFQTRYFITTNGLPLEKGKNYVQWSLFGPDIQFSITDHLGAGVMTSWFGIPVIGTIKYSWSIKPKVHVAVGGLVGTGSWFAPGVGGALPFTSLTFGTGRSNITFSGGWGAFFDLGDVEGRGIVSVAAMSKVGRKVSLVFDSFIVLPGKTQTYTTPYYTYQRERQGVSIFIPGVRIHGTEKASFQFGFAAVVAEGDLVPVPLPMVQWFRSF